MRRATENTSTSTPARQINVKRFSVRTLLIACTVIAICCAIWCESARRQHAAVVTLREKGVMVYYDFEVARDSTGYYNVKTGPGGFTEIQAVSAVPSWLLNSLGVDYFHHAVPVYLRIPRPIDALPYLKRLPNLKEVHYPNRGEVHDQDYLDQLRKELPGVKVVADCAVVG